MSCPPHKWEVCEGVRWCKDCGHQEENPAWPSTLERHEAAYDPLTDTITGCEPGTYAYWHEERHRQQYARPGKLDKDARRVVMAFNQGLIIVPTLVIFAWIMRGWEWALIACGVALGCSYSGVWINTLFMEIDAHLYAILRWWRSR